MMGIRAACLRKGGMKLKLNLCDILGHHWQRTMAANVDRCARGCEAIQRWNGRQWVIEAPKKPAISVS
jgi:hypothetical protein